jgi:hypothetical protein
MGPMGESMGAVATATSWLLRRWGSRQRAGRAVVVDGLGDIQYAARLTPASRQR